MASKNFKVKEGLDVGGTVTATGINAPILAEAQITGATDTIYYASTKYIADFGADANEEGIRYMTAAGDNRFAVGDVVSVTGMNIAAANVTNKTIVSVSGQEITVFVGAGNTIPRGTSAYNASGQTPTMTKAASTYLTPGTAGQVLKSTGTGVEWGTGAGYSAPTLGSTSIASGATVTTIAGLTLSSPTISVIPAPKNAATDLSSFVGSVIFQGFSFSVSPAGMMSTQTLLDGINSGSTVVSITITSGTYAGTYAVNPGQLGMGDVTFGVQSPSGMAYETIPNSNIVFNYEASTVTAGELSKLDGVTSNIQAQIDSKASVSGTETLTNKTLESPNIVLGIRTGETNTTLNEPHNLTILTQSGPLTATVPNNNTFPCSVGTQLNILQGGAGQITIAPASGVTLNGTPGLKLRAQWSSATIIKINTNTWVAVGDLSA